MSYEMQESKLCYSGKIMDVYSDTLIMPNGKTATREYIVREGASAIVPIDNDGNIIFVRQYRHPLRSYILEIPAGMLEKDEDPKVCAMRELEEEIGKKADDLRFVSCMHASVGICTEKIYIYIAENLKSGVQKLDEDEFVEIEKYSLDESVNMIFDGRISDSKTIVGILAYKELLATK